MNKHDAILGVSLCAYLLTKADINKSAPKASTNASTINPDSQLSKPISLKDITTGVKTSKAVKDGYYGHWSYFGKDRVVQTEELADGTIASITILMDGGEAFNLRNELEAKYSKEEGRVVRFDCKMTDRRLAVLNDAKIWDYTCTLSHGNQILTVYEVNPDGTNLFKDHYNLSNLFYSTKVTLVETGLVSQRNADIAKKDADARKDELSKAKQDL